MNPTEFARLQWRCRRGLLELDLLLQGFLDRGYDRLDSAERDHFAALLALPDPQLLAYLLGLEAPPDQGGSDVIEKIRCAAAP